MHGLQAGFILRLPAGLAKHWQENVVAHLVAEQQYRLGAAATLKWPELMATEARMMAALQWQASPHKNTLL
jgi:hypothetical protein